MVRLLERAAQPRRMVVDREGGWIENVKVCGGTSANGRSYPAATLERARGLYEGKQVNVDHPEKLGQPTRAASRFGWLEGVYVKDGALWARRLHFLKSHPMAEMVCEAAERAPHLFGLSHNSSGRTVRRGATEVVEAIEAVHSVDLVADPASVAGLCEGRRGGGSMTTTPRNATKWLRERGCPRKAALLWEQVEAGLLAPDTEMDLPTDAGGAVAEDDALKGALGAAWQALWDAHTDDVESTVRKARKLLRTLSSLGRGNGAAAVPDMLAPAEGGDGEDVVSGLSSAQREGLDMARYLNGTKLTATEHKALAEYLQDGQPTGLPLTPSRLAARANLTEASSLGQPEYEGLPATGAALAAYLQDTGPAVQMPYRQLPLPRAVGVPADREFRAGATPLF